MSKVFSVLIRLAYLLQLRGAANDLQRWYVERDAPRAPVPQFATPEAMVEYARSRFDWREDKDAAALPFADWSSHPEVFQARLESGSPVDGDCDDYHAWCCEVLKRIPGVSDVMLISAWTWERGHTTCSYRYRGAFYHIDYTIRRMPSHYVALASMAARRKWGPLRGWVFETPALDLITAYPRCPDE